MSTASSDRMLSTTHAPVPRPRGRRANESRLEAMSPAYLLQSLMGVRKTDGRPDFSLVQRSSKPGEIILRRPPGRIYTRSGMQVFLDRAWTNRDGNVVIRANYDDSLRPKFDDIVFPQTVPSELLPPAIREPHPIHG